MAIDAAWLARVRQKNREAAGLAGMGGLGQPIPTTPPSAQRLVEAGRESKEYRTQSIHAGRLQERDPNKPTEGSIESIAQAIGNGSNLPPPQAAPRALVYLTGALALGVVGLIAYRALKE